MNLILKGACRGPRSSRRTALQQSNVPGLRGFPSRFICSLLLLLASSVTLPVSGQSSFEVATAPDLLTNRVDGRLFVVLSPTNHPEPRLHLPDGPRSWFSALATDVAGMQGGSRHVVDQSASVFCSTNWNSLPRGVYYAQALFDCSRDLRLPDAPGNCYSPVVQLNFDPEKNDVPRLELTREVPAESMPPDTEQIKYIRLESRLLSAFFGRPMFLRAAIVLPPDYSKETSRRYPLWVRIGGFGTRFTEASGLLNPKGEFAKVWQAANTPRFLLLQLDGAGPFGDPYYVDSANNGPYGRALTEELIPFVETQFRAVGSGQARVLSGVSTGGWVAFALQVFYPDTFNGSWAFCPDPVDFRALETLDIYREPNAYVNPWGNERPSERTVSGDVVLTLRGEVGRENFLARGGSYVRSGGQWGSWNAVFSPRGTNGLPLPLFDPVTGAIDRAVAEAWRSYDLSLYLQKNWAGLAPKLKGKLHITASETDQYFLSNAVHLLQDALAGARPRFDAWISYAPRQPHGWSGMTLRQQLDQMQAAVAQAR